MTLPVKGIGIRTRGLRHPLVRVLLASLLFEVCVLAGVLGSPLLQDWMPQRLAQSEDPTMLLVRWRQSMYDRDADPAIGQKAPPLTLRTPAGERWALTALRGKKAVLVFARDGSS
jgi:hypothetical protein